MSLLAVAAIAVSFVAPTHTPVVNARWNYAVGVTNAGKPIRATITAQIVDPFGGAHPVAFGCCDQKYVTNHPFRGVFRDHIEFPPESRGFKLTLRFTIRALGARRVVTYWIRPR